MKILNLYAGIGGNRKLWGNRDVTAIEADEAIANVYQSIYPTDTVVVGDSIEFLEKHFKEFDFIWVSPPCPSHGQYRHNVGVIGKGFKPLIPDMSLYAQIIFLQYYAIGKWVVENVKPYYVPLIKPSFELHRHLFWANFTVEDKGFKPAKIRSKNKISDFDGFEIVSNSSIKNKRQVLRNCVLPELGLYILENAI
jgi:DNA (cytosine-5)-methyltransferase 1